MKPCFYFLPRALAAALLALGLLAGAAPARAQSRNLYDWAWVSRLGPTALPGPGVPVPPAIGGQAEHLAADGAGNVLIAGVYDTNLIFDNPAVRYQAANGPLGRIRNGYLARYTASGALAWSHDFSSAQDMGMYDVATDGPGNVYVIGSYVQQLRLDGSIVALTANTVTSFLAKFSPAGALLWLNNVEPDAPATNLIGVQHLATDAAGNCAVLGNFATRIVFNGTTYVGTSGRSHNLVARYNAAGIFTGAFASNTLAGSPSGLARDYEFTGLGLAPTGEVYLSGNAQATATLVFGNLPAFSGPSTANAAGFVVKLGPANTADWLLSTTGPARQNTNSASGQFISGVGIGPQGRCYAVGGLYGSTMTLGPQALGTGNAAGATGRDLFVARIAPGGTVESLVGGGGTDKMWGCALGPQGEVTIGIRDDFDWATVQLRGMTGLSPGLVGLVQFDAAGVPQRGWQVGGTFRPYAPLVAVDGQNRPVLAGTEYGTTPFVFGNRQFTSPYAWHTLIARTGTVVLATRPAAQVTGLEVYPNPARNLVEVRTAQAGPTRVQLLDALGRSVRMQMLTSGQTGVALVGLAAGSYTLLVQQGEARSFRHLVVQP